MRFTGLLGLWLLPWSLHASFIESTMGTAVVNDATSTYHNPAALILVKKPQVVGLASQAVYRSQFTGTTIEALGGFTQSGTSNEHTNYSLPSGYMALPIGKQLRLGFAVLLDQFHSDMDEPSILKYDHSNNQIKNTDYTLGLAVQLNDYISIGGGATYTNARYSSHRITGFPRLEVPDSQSHNVTVDDSYGWNLGFLIEPSKSTKIGFDYRSAVAYQFSGYSEFEGPPVLLSNNFNFNFWTPARSVLTLSQFLKPTLGFIATVQRIQWSIFNTVTLQNVATQVGRQALIVPTAIVPYHFKDTWVLTLGGIKKINSLWTVRVAGTYIQAPGNGWYRVVSGDDYIVGASVGYQMNKNLAIDAGYAHAFTQGRAIDIAGLKRVIGINQGSRDSVSLKLTVSS